MTFAATIGIGFLLAPRAALDYWTELLADTERIGGLAYAGNQSWNGLVVRVTGELAGGGSIWLALVAVTVVAGFWACRLLWRRGELLGAVAVCGVVSLLCSPVSWSHHWVWVIPLGVALAVRLRPEVGVAAALGWFGLFTLAPIWWPPRRDNRELHWSFADHLVGDCYLWLSILAVAALVVLTRPGELPPAQAGRTWGSRSSTT